jgi:hypothetical protein
MDAGQFEKKLAAFWADIRLGRPKPNCLVTVFITF